MACPVLITSVDVLDNPSSFSNPLQFEIQYECVSQLEKGEHNLQKHRPGWTRLQPCSLVHLEFKFELASNSASTHNVSTALEGRCAKMLRVACDCKPCYACWCSRISCPGHCHLFLRPWCAGH